VHEIHRNATEYRTMTRETIGVIGTGIMGSPMSRNLLSAGYPLCIHTRTRDKARALVEQGATWCDRPEELAHRSSVIVTVLPDSPDVESVYFGEGSVCAGVHSGALCIDMSTVSPAMARRVAEALGTRGAAFLDAPVSGGKTGAEAGTLSIMVGGRASDVDRARPVLEVLGRNIVHCGPVGTGQLTKLCNQILCGLNLLGVCEALVFARRAGLDLPTTLAAVSKGAAGSWALDNLGRRMIERDFAPMFMIDLQNKDLRITLETARAANVPLPGTALVSQLLAANQALGEGREGTQAMVKVLERLANIE
jgi:3-hydroxyisobutyrate dehydrogenase